MCVCVHPWVDKDTDIKHASSFSGRMECKADGQEAETGVLFERENRSTLLLVCLSS